MTKEAVRAIIGAAATERSFNGGENGTLKIVLKKYGGEIRKLGGVSTDEMNDLVNAANKNETLEGFARDLLKYN